MTRGGFLRRLLAAPAGIAMAGAAEHEPEMVEAELPDTNAVLSLRGPCRVPAWTVVDGRLREMPDPRANWKDSGLAFECDAAGNWYARNSATGRVTKL